jgi:YidC/Oxa1 family membrane protein insertase
MDRKSIIVIVACMGLMFLWSSVLVPRLYPPIPAKAPTPGASNAVATAQSPTPATSTATPAAGAGTFIRPSFTNNIEAASVVLTNENARYAFTALGGGLSEIELVKYPEMVSHQHKGSPTTNSFATLNANAQLPVLAVVGSESWQGDGVFALTQTGNTLRAEKTLADGLRIVKEFQLGTNYLLHANVRLENTSNHPLTLPTQEWVIGTATPMGADDDGTATGVMWSDGVKHQDTLAPYFNNKRFGCMPATPRSEYRGGVSNVVWAAPHNQFFALVAMPDTPAQEIVARAIELPRPPTGRFSFTNSPDRKGFETTLVYPGLTIEPGKSVERSFNLYAGPKEYRTLASVAGRLQTSVDEVMNFGFFGFISKALLLGMNWLHSALSIPYGWAIIVITVLLKIIFWPLTAISTRSAKRMADMAPQLKALQEKYKDDPQKLPAKQWEFYRENKINPMSGCLPMLVQLPVFFGLFAMLRTAIELRGAHFLWAVDLSKADTLFIIPGLSFIPFISTPEGLPFNLLPILYISTAIWQTHITPMSPGMDPAQQKMMRWMPLMFLVILYNFSGGLALYMTVNNLLTILQTKITKTAAARASGTTPPTPTASVLTPASKKKK